jgi:hypothetical protein
MCAAVRDKIAERLLESGLIDSVERLDLNGVLEVPRGFTLPAPWGLPSRMFLAPLSVSGFDGRSQRTLRLRHRLLVDHPFVWAVNLKLDTAIPAESDADDPAGGRRAVATWQHAADLLAAGLWRELIDTERFSTPQDICNAIALCLLHLPYLPRHGHSDTGWARAVLSAIGSTAPTDRAGTVFSAVLPACPIRDTGGQERWPINPGECTPEALAWAAIFGIEAGWFERHQSGFPQWSAVGRGLCAERNTVAGLLLRAEPSAWF